MARIFAYIVHKGGVADDSAAELAAAAKSIDATIAPIAVVTGWGPEVDAVCESLRSSYARYGKSPIRRSPIPTLNWSAKPW